MTLLVKLRTRKGVNVWLKFSLTVMFFSGLFCLASGIDGGDLVMIGIGIFNVLLSTLVLFKACFHIKITRI
ncbi:MAG: hypothetical protein GQ564_02190 [Bacteroidales bacterium]|nr:hypothetical protein [Bacteroidales bacterium]